MNYGDTIRELRKQKGISLRSFAKECGISANALCSIENNKNEPSKETLQKLSQALDVPVILILLKSITEEDIPENKREAFHDLKGPLAEFLESE